MYKTAAETAAFFEAFAPLVAKSSHAEIVICPPFVNIPAAVAAAKGTAIEVGGQDLFWLREALTRVRFRRPCWRKWVAAG